MASQEIPVYRSQPATCSYLPDRLAQNRFIEAPEACGSWYEELLSARWRRAGRIIYQPACPDCRLCQPIRIPIAEFTASPSQKRTLRKNQDLRISLSSRLDDPAALALYTRYQTEWHHATDPGSPESASDFLGQSPVDSRLMLYHLGSELLGTGWVDVLDQGISSVYFAFAPEHARRRLGVFSLLQEIELGRRLGKTWLYLGFWVPGCASMEYKSGYLPHEILVDGEWRRNWGADDANRGSSKSLAEG